MRKKRFVLLGLTLLWTCIIISFSLQPANISSNMSSGFGKWLLERFLPGIYGQLEAIPMQQLEFWHTVLRKCGHFAEYFALGVLWRVTLWEPIADSKGKQTPGSCDREKEAFRSRDRAGVMYGKYQKVLGAHCKAIIAQVLCTLSAMADETVQLFVPGRSGQVTDVLLDSAGAFTGILFVLLTGRIYRICVKRFCR